MELIDLTGEKFGRLTVTGRGPDRIKKNGTGQTQWYCECSCGNKTLVSSRNLRSGNSKSCGCLQQDKTKESNLKQRFQDNESAKRNRYNAYKIRAARKGIPFLLTRKEFDLLIEQNCYYCHRPPGNVSKHDYHYQGIDRLDSKKGYTLDNVVPCCFICNRAKGNLSVQDFISWIRDLLFHFT